MEKNPKSSQKKYEDRDTGISKTLSYLLRHGAMTAALPMQPDGFVNLNLVLQHREMRKRGVSVADVQRIVENNDKKRFSMKQEGDLWVIKANQGHSMKEVSALSLKKLSLEEVLEMDVVHGTYFRFWGAIKKEGLKSMRRNHIHFASTAIFKDAVSGFRNNAEILIFIDVASAIKDKIEFFKSENGVILTEGINGTLEPKYFKKVLDRKCNEPLNVF